jgi:limonene-1,2-epoxide hydrolase
MPDRATTASPGEVVRSFLLALEAGDLAQAEALLAEDAVWINVSLPTVSGRDRIMRLMGILRRPGIGVRVHFHNVATDGGTVLTERSDALLYGPVEQRFWVWGRFEVRAGKIEVWRDSFDWRDYVASLLRGVAGAVRPGLNRPWPDLR